MRNLDAETVITSIAGNVPKPQAVYLGDDAVMHCARCNQPVEIIRTIFGKQRTLPIICQCKQKEIDEENRKRKQELIDAKRRACFGSDRVNMISCTFEADNRYNADVSDMCLAYAENFKRHIKTGRGLLLCGTVGTGKTFYAASICNRVIDKGYTALFTTFNAISNQILSGFDGKSGLMSELRRPSLLVLDDIGAERATEYMQEVVFSVIDDRINTGKPLIITGNIDGKQLANPATLHQRRIYDRILQACLPVEVVGKSIRRKEATEWHQKELNLIKAEIEDMKGGAP